MSWLLDTNVISEIRKGPRGDPGVLRWAGRRQGDVWLSVLTVGEIRRGIELKRRKDEVTARQLEVWLQGLLGSFASRILPIDGRVAEVWGRLNVPDPRPTVDTLLAATAIVHGLTLVTRNVGDVAGTGVKVYNPFEGG
ncbi:type II toxin-antitoxin system VapC family toxin [Myxococcota bacterium]|nr:type II toxin-antitoxin system VapC family toxin [Myxococcota bacterium]